MMPQKRASLSFLVVGIGLASIFQLQTLQITTLLLSPLTGDGVDGTSMISPSRDDKRQKEPSAQEDFVDHHEELLKSPGSSATDAELDTINRLAAILQTNASDFNIYEPKDIPVWSQIVQKYGEGPKILGLETCQEYQDLGIQQSERWLAPAGLFHTGTNLLANLLEATCKSGIDNKWQVPWGKHNPAENRRTDLLIQKLVYNSTDISSVFPVVMVRHPLDWMKSMCQKAYNTKWNRTAATCPDLSVGTSTTVVGNPVQVGMNPTPRTYSDLLSVWTEWNQGYVAPQTTVFPRLIVRLEDLVFHPESTLTQICKCVGDTSDYNRTETAKVWTTRQGGRIVPSKQDKKPTALLLQSWQRHAWTPTNLEDALPRKEDVTYIRSQKLASMRSLLDSLGYQLH